MKRKLLIALVTVLAVLMMGSVVLTALSMAKGSDGFTSGKYSFDLLSEEKTFNTTTPNHLFDFTTEDIQSTFANTANMTVSMGEGYTTFTATADDPYTWIQTPQCRPNQAQYAVICYRTTAAYKGEFFCTRSDNGAMGSDGTNQQWDWNPSGEWETLVVSMDAWKGASDSITFDIFRFDPLQKNVAAGSSIDVKYAAFFASEADAKGFNYDEYVAKLAYEEEQKKAEEEANKDVDWPDPEYKEKETSAEDTYAGTLKYTTSEDGKTVTISYEVNGETLSYTVPNNNNYLFGGYSATDDLNRPLYDSNEVGSYKADERYIGLFYFLWQGEHGDSGAFDLQKIIDEVGIDAADNVDCGKYGPAGAMHWFAEPLYGYYYANDGWVLKKHAELLTMANIDFLFFDVTNGYTYRHNATKLMGYLHELNEAGFDAPQVVFYTNTNAHGVVRELYDNIYKKGIYEDTWFCLDGKPVIVAPYDANINDFFTIQQNQWPNDPNFKENGWPWMDFEWPQRVFKDENGNPNAINVSVAQHSGTVCFSHSSLYDNYNNRGRSFTNSDGYPSSHSRFKRTLKTAYEAWKADQTLTNYGLNFQAQWDHAIASEAPIILVTGWNEWVAQRQPTHKGSGNEGNNPGWIYFVDTASMEFSRDTEMMRGGYFDNYYMQLIYNVQKAKGTAPIVVQDSRKPINVTGEFDQWNDVTVTYVDATGDTMDRDAIGFGRTPYTNTSGRNDIEIAKVTSDSKNLYFYVKTVDDITMFDTKSSWMQLYLNVDGRDAENGETGWYGYDFVVNYQAKDTFTTTVAKYNGTDGKYGFESVGEVSYRVKNNEMMIEVPLSLLGIEYYKAINIEFKWADSETVYDEMEDFYCDGDIAPLGRLNYIYQNYIPGVNDPEPETTAPETTEAPTEPVTEPTTETTAQAPATEAPSESVTESVTDDEKDGCGAIVGTAALLAMIALAGTALVCRKKED